MSEKLIELLVKPRQDSQEVYTQYAILGILSNYQIKSCEASRLSENK